MKIGDKVKVNGLNYIILSHCGLEYIIVPEICFSPDKDLTQPYDNSCVVKESGVDCATCKYHAVLAEWGCEYCFGSIEEIEKQLTLWRRND